MTDSQYKYQSLMEEQRHNLMMEKYAHQEQQTKALQAVASLQQATASLKQADVALQNAESREKEVRDRGTQIATDIGFSILGFLIPDANTVVNAAAKLFS